VSTLIASVSVTVTARVVIYANVRCGNPSCGRNIMAIPGPAIVSVSVVKSNAERSGRGRVVQCKRCLSLCEVVEHTRPAA
jgi:hypothetical protein